MTPSDQSQAEQEIDYGLMISIRVSPRTEECKDGQEIMNNMRYKCLEMVEDLQPIFKKLKIKAEVVGLPPKP